MQCALRWASRLVLLWLAACAAAAAAPASSPGAAVAGAASTTQPTDAPLRVALAVDLRSVKDFLVLAHSVVLTAVRPERLVLHVVACGKTLDEAKKLRDLLVDLVHKCLPSLLAAQVEVMPFTLPPSSGFAKQLVTVVQKSHWYSPTGADMARFFLAELFPLANRLLYLDNDIVVTCCLEEIYATPFDSDDIAGIVLDDLKWATSTQFYRHYNRTHPLVVKNVRRSSAAAESKGEVTGDEFMKALPKYPNDGVLLIDVQRWRQHGILPLMNEIAEANGRGDYVVSMGTQQFTVLALHDRWKELTPRANLRHFPDMARGFLMWYLYNGIVHFAGQSKPQHICDANSALDHRAVTYHSWALNVDYLARGVGQACARIVPNNTRKCGELHVPRADTLPAFFDLANAWLRGGGGGGGGGKGGRGDESGLLYMRIGGLYNWGAAVAAAPTGGDPLARFDRLVLENATWSWRVFDADEARSKRSQQSLSGAGASVGRKWLVVHDKICDGTDEIDANTGQVVHHPSTTTGGYPVVDRGGNLNDYAESPAVGRLLPCLSILASIKMEGKNVKTKKAHWDVAAIAIDVLPSPGRERASSLGALLSLELEFMRPKFIIARLGTKGQLPIAKRFLQRHGYLVGDGGAGGGSGGANVVYGYRVNKLEMA